MTPNPCITLEKDNRSRRGVGPSSGITPSDFIQKTLQRTVPISAVATQTVYKREAETADCYEPRHACQAIDCSMRASRPSSAAALLAPLARFLRFAGKLDGVRLLKTRKPPKIDPLMSQPYSPTGKRFIRPILWQPLKDPPKPPAPLDHHREELRRIIVALGLWIAFLLMLYRLIQEHGGAATKIFHP